MPLLQVSSEKNTLFVSPLFSRLPKLNMWIKSRLVILRLTPGTSPHFLRTTANSLSCGFASTASNT